jgi:NitT/TauT family transport system substrate-binding protein
MMRKRCFWVAVALVSILVTGACAGTPTPPAPTDTLASAPTATEAAEAPLPDIGPIRIGHLPISGHARTFVAVEKGYFEEQGLEVELQVFRSASLMIAPLSAGQLDVGAGAVSTPLFNAVHQGLDVRAVAGTSGHRGDTAAIYFGVRKDLYDSGEVTEPADLKGRKVAVNVPHGLAEYFVANVLALGDLTVDDVELVPIPFPEIPAALANKAVDAAYLSTSIKDKALADGSVHLLFKVTDVLDPYQTGLLFFGERLLDPANREAAVRVLVAYIKATREIYGEGFDGFFAEEHLPIIHKHTDIPIDRLRVQEVAGFIDLNLLVARSSVEKTQAYFVNRGYMDFGEPLAFEQFYDASFLEEALKRIGRVEN